MKSVLYEEGPDAITMGDAGRFERGVPREIDDETAALLLAKPLFREAPKTFGAPAKKSKTTDREES